MKNIDFILSLDNETFISFMKDSICPVVNFFETDLVLPCEHSSEYPALCPLAPSSALGFSLWLGRNYMRRKVLLRGLAFLLLHAQEKTGGGEKNVRGWEAWLEKDFNENDKVWTTVFGSYLQPLPVTIEDIIPQNMQLIIKCNLPLFTEGFEVRYRIGFSEPKYQRAKKGDTSILLSDLPNNTEIAFSVRSFSGDKTLEFSEERIIILGD